MLKNRLVSLLALTLSILSGRAAEPALERTGVTLHVSKRGDNSDGSSWAKAFHTIQAALLAVPDDRGGHRILVRPDTYVEANLYPAHKGAARVRTTCWWATSTGGWARARPGAW